jgi:hypothetical protein
MLHPGGWEDFGPVHLPERIRDELDQREVLLSYERLGTVRSDLAGR